MAVLYAIESLAWVPGESVLIVRSWPVRPGVGRPWQVFATRRGRVLASGWAPSDVGLLAAPWPVSMADGQLVNRPAHAMFDDRVTESLPLRTLRVEEVRKVGVLERELWVNGERFADAVSVEQARVVAKALRRVRDAAAERRGELWDRAQRSTLDERRAERRWVSFEREVRAAQWLAWALVGLVFAVLPVAYTTVGLTRWWAVLIPVYLALVGLAAGEAWRLHRRFYPRQRAERWKQAVLTFVAPTHAMRLPDHAAHALLSGFHPVVVARVIGSERQAEEAAREAWLSVKFPRSPGGEREAERAARERWAERLTQWLMARRYPVQTWSAAPQRSDPRVEAYCPRCHAQYVNADAGCRACGGVGLVPFHEPR